MGGGSGFKGVKARDNLIEPEVLGVLCGHEDILILGKEGHDFVQARQGM